MCLCRGAGAHEGVVVLVSGVRATHIVRLLMGVPAV